TDESTRGETKLPEVADLGSEAAHPGRGEAKLRRAREPKRAALGRADSSAAASLEDHELVVLTTFPTYWNVVLALEPSALIAAMHTTMISASMTAYSTAVGPSSRCRKSTSWLENRVHMGHSSV